MMLNDTTLKELRDVINEKSKYRSGPELVEFFNALGFNEKYGKGFPSRWMYTDDKLREINGKPELDKCLKILFAPNSYIGNYHHLDEIISDFNQYISYDGWLIKRNDREIIFVRTSVIYEKVVKVSTSEKEFLNIDYGEIDLSGITIKPNILSILENRLKELKILVESDAQLSSIIMMGSILEGLLLAIATRFPKNYNQSDSSPKEKDGSVKKIYNWTLSDLIFVTYELGIFKEDVHKFTSTLRYFRNYIHPYQQLSTGFNPSRETVKICYQVLKAAIVQITQSSLFKEA